jgi:hypothetical protein
MTQVFVFANNVNTQLAASVSSSATTITLVSGDNLPTLLSGQYMPITLNDAATNNVYEVMYVTAISGTTLTVIRGQEGTANVAWAAGDYAFSTVTQGTVAAVNGNPLNVFKVGQSVVANDAVNLGSLTQYYSVAQVFTTVSSCSVSLSFTAPQNGVVEVFVNGSVTTANLAMTLSLVAAGSTPVSYAQTIDTIKTLVCGMGKTLVTAGSSVTLTATFGTSSATTFTAGLNAFFLPTV